MEPFSRLRAGDLVWERLSAGAELFDAGEFWHAHEAWEVAWRAYHGEDRDYLKGLIQLAAANFHLARGKPGPARRLLDSAARHLERCNPLAWPFDTAHLIAVTAALVARIDQGKRLAPAMLRLGAMFRDGDRS